ncbi:hypothetical protein N7493_011351 [Penicillium malachiteum]|uniref:Aminoglycoside phosphotransferase domain-containing protein n=1 Tax=Penicillium malachiteum TaxID=1324776 RepID=A0AAD6MR59_9EURO|nr:hypothetical protein N7493_011351 [Penicillium malachiteum]
MQLYMRYDDVVWEQSDDISDNWLLQFIKVEILRGVGQFVLMNSEGDGPEFAVLKKGFYNLTLRMKYEHSATHIRFTQPGTSMFPEEQVHNEVAIMRYILDKTSVPVPFIHRSSSKAESPLKLSPYIMMDHIEHDTKMYAALNIPGCPTEKRGYLDPNIDEGRLEKLYGQSAGILIQLLKPELPYIGSLCQIDDFTWEVTRRPLTMNMNELVRVGTLPQSKLPAPNATYNTASSYVEALASLNIQHLIYQRNDAIESEDDCRRKFVARQLFYKLAKAKRVTKFENGPFKLWCDDLRPANILLNNDLQIVGVVDWEFTYAAPAEFSYAPPWWLLIETPESWEKGLEDWTQVFDYRLKTFIKVMRAQNEGQFLADRMQDSWESGDFWVVCALLHSFAFDAIYWNKIDTWFFGPTASKPEDAWKERLALLDEEEISDMEKLVSRQMEEMKSRPLAWDPDNYTEEFWQNLKRRREEEARDQEKEL